MTARRAAAETVQVRICVVTRRDGTWDAIGGSGWGEGPYEGDLSDGTAGQQYNWVTAQVPLPPKISAQTVAGTVESEKAE